MAQTRNRQKIPDISSPDEISYPSSSVLPEDDRVFWDVHVEIDEEIEEEEITYEPSYEIFVPPPLKERDIGTIIRETYGLYKKPDLADEVEDRLDDNLIYKYTLSNSNGVSVQIITLGATIISIRMPDDKNVINDITLGLNNLADYKSEKNNLLFGSLLGRFNGIISEGSFNLQQTEYLLSRNLNGIHHEKGGFDGFDKVMWRSYVAYDRVIMTHVSPHLDEGYPGDLMVQISFHLTKDNCLSVTTTAETSLPTILSVGHHIFFNLGGHETGSESIYEHIIQVNADGFIKVDNNKVPTGEIESIGATYFDLRIPRPISKILSLFPRGGYDDVFCLNTGYKKEEDLTFACRLIHPPSGRVLEIMTDMPGLHVNTGNQLPNIKALPPLEAQVGFKEEFYPEFCKEEKEKEPGTESTQKELKLQSEMAAKQSWPPQEPVSEAPIPKILTEIPAPLTLESSLEKKVSFTGGKKKTIYKEKNDKVEIKDKVEKKEKIEKKVDSSKPKRITKPPPPKENIDEKLDNIIIDDSETNEEEIVLDDSIVNLKFLKDFTGVGVEERPVSKWHQPQPIVGRKGVQYSLNGGICLMTQEYPDCMRYKSFPKPVVWPGHKFSRTTVYRFGIINQKNYESPEGPKQTKIKFNEDTDVSGN